MSKREDKRNVVLGITGSIAAYKSAELARLLVARGYTVKVVMTPAAQEFISPLTMQSVTGNPVATSLWDESETQGIGHINLADWADVFVVAPATADIIAKIAHGFADSALLASLLATKAPVLIAPAMNVNMFDNPQTQANLAALKSRGVEIVDPEEGALACGWNGTGRLADPWEIFYAVMRAIADRDLSGKRIVITTGPTREPIDPVRSITNRSSGKMGVALAREAYRRGAEVTLIHGPVDLRVPSPIKCIPVLTAKEMEQQVMAVAFDVTKPVDVVIMAAAVGDYRPKNYSETKIKKDAMPAAIALERNPDILLELGTKRGDEPRPVLVGFAVETGEEVEDLITQVQTKLKSKKADIIVGNFAGDAFELDTNRVWIVDRNGKQVEVAHSFKSRVAEKILDSVCKL